MKKIAIFASGSGSNAENIARFFKERENLNIECIYSNKNDAYVLQRAHNLLIPSKVFTKNDFYFSDIILNDLKNREVDLIVLAGFLWLVPQNLIDNFPIINIHPALLPKYGGKGMYGDNVHKAVVANGEKESGITIHYVNDKYDDGQIIFQAKCEVLPTDTADDVAKKVHQLEYRYFPEIIEKVVLSL
ncbi:MAG TPA: phosphoribosylglycinamide formyltransferase [Prolixibacteraceae bacterium]|jgi:phosphoribosylglycinamide formyltransferase-1|nr:phosphoribosylglycinamide formyltransferase [Bacteroidales bacterium]HNZ72392.1 phosphoribosylglycinamide formyltransferase [Prolixibacteraceae bacterium]HQN93609.1 phosphoribosylglycinamide formyltransferase [Prolixibacteraceae bacterium]HUM88585.1 phosphoribosylglycinamide formyltransferase [Prolixibacteraceae bacterium]